MRAQSFYRAILGLTLVSVSLTAAAQQAPQDLASLPTASIAGKIVGVEQGKIYVTSGLDQYVVHVLSTNQLKTEVVVSGTALPEFLRPGVFLYFKCMEMDKKGNVTGDVTDLKVMTPTETTPAGVVGNSMDGTPGGPYEVLGIVRKNLKGKLTVAAGKTQVKFDLPMDAVIALETADYSIVQEGDDITVMGRLAQQGATVDGKTQPSIAVGDKIDIKLAAPAALPSKKKKKKPASAGAQ